MEGDSVKTAGKGVIHRLSLDALDRDHYASGQENECHLHWQDLKSIGYIDAEKEETLIIYMMSDDLAESREDNMVNEGPGTANAVTNDVSGNVKSKLHQHILIPM
ncbi:12227_t:CDS:2 [Entrophospora sp. SA101]|nr:12227_t:CDS:2 [Entrophospora sp. SA101]